MGRAEIGTLLVLIHTFHELDEQEVTLRIISARQATKHERQHYEYGL